MDQATLVGPDLSAGRELVSVLDAAHLKEIVAVFTFLPEYADWRLVLSSPSLDQVHLLRASEKLHQILQGRFVYSLPPVMLLPTKDPFIRGLKKLFVGKVKAGGVIRMGGQMIGDKFASEIIIVRLPGVNG